MLNNEVGTYKLAEGINLQPTLIASVEGRIIKAIINDEEVVGNWNVIKLVCDTSKIKKRKRLVNNEIDRKYTAKELLNEQFGVFKEGDVELIYDPTEVFKSASRNANKVDNDDEVSNFKLDTNDDRRLL